MYKYLILILLSISILFVACDNNKPEEVKKEEQVNQEATDNFDNLVEEGNEEVDEPAGYTTDSLSKNTDTLKSQPEVSASAGDLTKKPIEAQIIVVSDIVTGNFRKLTKDIAKQLVANGEILAVKTSDNVYFVYNQDGTLASKKLAGYANNSKVMLAGKTKTIDGVNIIIVDVMEGK